MAVWARQKITSFSLDMLPRTTRAQTMDVLSSQANIAGYKAVLVAAGAFPRYFPMFMTAAGSIPPAKVLVLGAGVAGLQAIATARRLGAVVEVFDTRPAVREEVMSLGGSLSRWRGLRMRLRRGDMRWSNLIDFRSAAAGQDRGECCAGGCGHYDGPDPWSPGACIGDGGDDRDDASGFCHYRSGCGYGWEYRVDEEQRDGGS